MRILNMGGQELIFVFLIMFLLLGPERMHETAKKTARFIRSIIQSKTWRQMLSIYSEVREIPKEIMKEADLDDLQKEVNKDLNEINNDLNQ